ncbi:MAG: response regulator transcription factor [Pseudohongiella sp.]|nr:response regulator transcription factor [Pseudohongiella sp.]MDO9521242.1 response regulator transcription factor [Pseudohongiella sp.]MDP2127301.1 response regulator transcription factor [Pseudohongiella sp.]
MNILVIEDNRDIAANIADYLEPLGHTLDFAATGTAGLMLATAHLNSQTRAAGFDVIVMDVMLPGISGLELCQQLRQQWGVTTPVLMLTARDQLDDKLEGFAAGADDYLVKPFSIRELEARLMALVKRGSQRSAAAALEVEDLVYTPDKRQAQRQGVMLELNPVQRRLLESLMRNSNRVVTREELEQHVWGDSPPDNDILRTHIYALRMIVDKPFSEKLIHTVHGIGYRLCAQREVR